MTPLLALLAVAAAPSSDSFLEEALFAGGARDEAELKRLVAKFHQRVDPMVEVVRGQSPAIAAQLLLKHLHITYGGTTAALVEYQSSAYSLKQTLDTGKYNCLSATIFFLLAARAAGLDVTGQWYRDHARAVVTIDGRRHQVEATSAWGFSSDFKLSATVDASTGAVDITARSDTTNDDWYLSTDFDGNGKPRVVVRTAEGLGTDQLLAFTWSWAKEPRDPRWAARLAPAPLTAPPLVAAPLADDAPVTAPPLVAVAALPALAL